MKIIFDNEEQKKIFYNRVISDYCPGRFGLSNCECDEIVGCVAEDCEDCWKNCGIEMEVKNDE